MNERHDDLVVRNYILNWKAAIVLMLGFAGSGCTLTVPSTPDSGSSAQLSAENPRPEDIWRALANAVRCKTIDSTTRLAQYVAFLIRNGELSVRDVTAFDAAFPRITIESRLLTEDDVQTLLQISPGRNR